MDKHQCNVGQRYVVSQFADAQVVGRLAMLLAPRSGIEALLAAGVPNLVAMIAQIVLIVLLQLFQARLCHVHELDTRLHRCSASFVALSNVLLA